MSINKTLEEVSNSSPDSNVEVITLEDTPSEDTDSTAKTTSESAGAIEKLDENSGKKSDDSNTWTPVKVCRVCGDRALSFNFGVVTCESCKAFFRRNGARVEDFACPFNGNCPTNIYSRKHCQKCRLRKCYEVGMRLDAISNRRNCSEQGRKKTAQLAAVSSNSSRDTANKKRKLSESLPDTTERSNTENAQVESLDGNHFHSTTSTRNESENNEKSETPMDTVDQPANQRDAGRDRLTSDNQKRKQDGSKGYEINTITEQQMDSVADKRQETSNNDPAPFKCLPMFRNDQPFQYCFNHLSLAFCDPENRTLTPCISHIALGEPLDSALKTVKLEELQSGNTSCNTREDLFQPLHGSSLEEITSTDLHNLTLHIFTQANKHHTLASFKELMLCDKLQLIKGRICDLVLIRLSIRFDKRTSNIRVGYPGCSDISVDLTKLYGKRFHKELLKFASSYPERYRNDESIFALLSAIAFFDPAGISMASSGAVDSERRIYTHLLNEYLHSTFGKEEGRWAFEYLTTWITCVSISMRLYKPCVRFDIDPFTFNISKLVVDDCMKTELAQLDMDLVEWK